mmetsp:Transcript_16549/g.24894  ORF Transcript_16549/g.24894 Transcript_16549/m.24894 type:complete len:491 (-) Transcript_16549:171-1643(-)|eukprot:CAMPEP_0185029924 /NCGR_PEP_ID=MMETSP1103-20130426/16571_1 /TAXON_ID=36769 /ORGANISM="Paraphysomonas bandaiensis, Strain Caron Lab Isolate" /LENGTH=490 /DNA_ID=CAMNT_0027564853 /DNA_START=60 /DNA_END=1532 /DNA_ORIENTATION=-
MSLSITSNTQHQLQLQTIADNPLSLLDSIPNENLPAHSSSESTSEEDRSDKDSDTAEASCASPELLCNLKDIEIPVDNDVVFAVNEDDDSIVISDAGSITDLTSGDILVAVNGHFISNYSEGRTIIEKERKQLLAAKKDGSAPAVLRLRTMSTCSTVKDQRKDNNVKKSATFFAAKFLKLSKEAYKKRHYHEALQLASRGFEVVSTSAGPSSIRCQAGCLEVQADCELAVGRDMRAAELYKEVIKLRSQVYRDEHHISLMRPVDTLSRIYRRHKAFTFAIHHATHLCDICSKNNLAVSRQMASGLANLARIRRAQGLLNECFLLEVEAFQMRVSVLGRRHPSVAQSLQSLAAVRMDLGDLGKGTEDLCTKALEIYSSSPSTCSSEKAGIYNTLSTLQHRRGNSKGREHFKQLEVSAREEKGVLSTSLAKSLWELGAIYQEEGTEVSGRQAHRCRAKAIHTLNVLFGPGNKLVMKYTADHERLSSAVRDMH